MEKLNMNLVYRTFPEDPPKKVDAVKVYNDKLEKAGNDIDANRQAAQALEEALFPNGDPDAEEE